MKELSLYPSIILPLATLLELLIIVLFSRTRPSWALTATLVSLYGKTHSFLAGYPLHPWHASSIIGLIYITSGRLSSLSITEPKAWRSLNLPIIAFFTLVFFSSLFLWPTFLFQQQTIVELQLPAKRVFSQLVQFLLIIGLYAYGLYLSQRISFIDIIKSFIVIAVVVATLGLAQALIYILTGTNIFPLVRDGELYTTFILSRTLRIGSVVGEPKHLGILLAQAGSFCYLLAILQLGFKRSRTNLYLLILTLALILTLSTTGFTIFILSIIVISLIQVNRLNPFHLALILLISLAATPLLIFSSQSSFFTDLSTQFLKVGFEVMDLSFIQALSSRPEFLLTGAGLGNLYTIAEQYLPHRFTLFLDSSYSSNTGLITTIAESGLLGLALLSMPSIYSIRNMYAINRLRLIGRLIVTDITSILPFCIIPLLLLQFLLRYDQSFFLLQGIACGSLALQTSHTSMKNRIV